jgi:hypothetical protein
MADQVFTSGQVLTAAQMSSLQSNIGLAYITEVAITGATTTVSGCFSSSFTNYKIVVDLTASAAAGASAVTLQLNGLSSGYAYNNVRNYGATINALTDAAGTSYLLGSTASSPCTFATSIEVFKPNLAATTTFTHNSHGWNSSDYIWYGGGCSVNNTTQYTGVVLSIAGGGTGKIFVYGYRQA